MIKMRSTLYSLLILTSLALNETLKVIHFKDSQSCSKSSLNVPFNSQKTVDKITICARFSIRFQTWMSLLSIKDIHSIELANFQKEIGFVGFNGFYQMFEWHGLDEILPDEWNNICYSFANNEMRMVLNGILLSNEITKNPSQLNISLASLNIGIRDINEYINGRFSGAISDVNIWGKELPLKEMIDFTQIDALENLDKPDLFDWNGISNVSINSECFAEEDIAIENFFVQKETFTIQLVQSESTFKDAILKCNAFGGEIFIPENEYELETLEKIVTSSSCEGIFIGGTKIENGTIIDLDGNPITFARWSKSEPNGKHIEKCIVAGLSSYEKFEYFDITCDSFSACFPCKVPTRQKLIIRGKFPLGSEIDRRYQINLTKMPLIMRGLSNSEMSFEGTKWSLGQNVWTKWQASELPPFGLNTWRFYENETNLLLRQDLPDKFACHKHGNLISMLRRCDGIVDCLDDGSDEENCNIFVLAPTYDKRQTPHKNDGMKSTPVNLKLHLKNIFDIEEITMTFKVRIRVSMYWFDPRITFRNLKNDSNENIVPGKLREKIWKPYLFFDNSNDGETTLFDSETSMHVIKQGEYQANPLDEIHQNYLYDGSENPIEIHRFYTVTLNCPFAMMNYPFDEQSCPVSLEVLFDRTKMVLSTEGYPTHKKRITLPQYEFQGLGSYKTSHDGAKVTIEIKLKRNFANHLVAIFIPTICLVIIAEMTLFINIKHFEATIMLTLTSMLVMYTLYQSVSAMLPPTAYMKMIDIWLFGGLIIPFIVLTILVVANELVNKDQSQINLEACKGQKILSLSRIIIPLSTLTLIILFIIFMIMH